MMHERGRRGRLEFAVFAVLIISFTVIAHQRNAIWRSDQTLWSDILQKSPLKARAHYNLGVILLENDRIEEAHERYRSALRLNPRYADAYINLGKVYIRQGRHSQAKEAFRAALLVEPGNVLAHFNLGVAYLDDGMNEEAAREFEDVLRQRPDHAQARQFLFYLERVRNAASRTVKP